MPLLLISFFTLVFIFQTSFSSSNIFFANNLDPNKNPHRSRNLKKKKTYFDSTLPDTYLDQVVKRKKKQIIDCALKNNQTFNNLAIHLTIFPSGKTKTRLINSLQTKVEVLQCTLDIFNRIQFKKFSGPRIEKNYYFIQKSISKKKENTLNKKIESLY